MQAAHLSLVLKSLMQTVHAASRLPTGDDFKFYASFESFSQQQAALTATAMRVLQKLMHKMMPHERASLSDFDDFERFSVLVDHVDLALERVDSSLDELRGVRNSHPPPGSMLSVLSPSVTGTTQLTGKHAHSASHSSRTGVHAPDTYKPQTRFQPHVDNSDSPFVPILKHKPHALTPLPNYQFVLESPSLPHISAASAISIADTLRLANIKSHVLSLGVSSSPELGARHGVAFPHPYETEIRLISYASGACLSMVKEQLFRPLAETPCAYVDSVEGVNGMMTVLRSATEIAIDLEHHDQVRLHLQI